MDGSSYVTMDIEPMASSLDVVVFAAFPHALAKRGTIRKKQSGVCNIFFILQSYITFIYIVLFLKIV